MGGFLPANRGILGGSPQNPTGTTHAREGRKGRGRLSPREERPHTLEGGKAMAWAERPKRGTLRPPETGGGPRSSKGVVALDAEPHRGHAVGRLRAVRSVPPGPGGNVLGCADHAASCRALPGDAPTVAESAGGQPPVRRSADRPARRRRQGLGPCPPGDSRRFRETSEVGPFRHVLNRGAHNERGVRKACRPVRLRCTNADP